MKHTIAALLLASWVVLPFNAIAMPDESSQSVAEQVQTQVVNINKADIDELQQVLFGVGEAKAKAIVDYRTTHGDFASVDEILEVKGIGPAILERNRNRLTLE